MSEKALSILSLSQYFQGLVAGVPNNIKIAHKFGERKFNNTGETQLHDCGIIYAPKTPYLLCVMTKTNNNIDSASNVIKKISQTVYQKITQNNQGSNPI
jgi:beta-lactamase class A